MYDPGVLGVKFNNIKAIKITKTFKKTKKKAKVTILERVFAGFFSSFIHPLYYFDNKKIVKLTLTTSYSVSDYIDSTSRIPCLR
jgi:hypothetical protein